MGLYNHGRSEYISVIRAGSIMLANLTANQAPVGGLTLFSNSAPKMTSSALCSYEVRIKGEKKLIKSLMSSFRRVG
jgi:hypothetical protein